MYSVFLPGFRCLGFGAHHGHQGNIHRIGVFLLGNESVPHLVQSVNDEPPFVVADKVLYLFHNPAIRLTAFYSAKSRNSSPYKREK